MAEEPTTSELARSIDLLREEMRRLGDRIDAAMSRHVTIDRYEAEMGEVRRDVADLVAAGQAERQARERLRLAIITAIVAPILVTIVLAVIGVAVVQGGTTP